MKRWEEGWETGREEGRKGGGSNLDQKERTIIVIKSNPKT